MPKNNHQSGALPLIILIAVLGLVGFLIIAGTFSFKSNLFSKLFPKPPSRAAGAVELSIKPSPVKVAPGSSFDLEVYVDTHGQSLNVAQMVIKWDPEYFEALPNGFKNGTLLKDEIVAPQVGSGVASATLGAGLNCPIENPNNCSPNPPVVGTGVLATLSLKALKETSSPVQVYFDPQTTEAAVKEQADNAISQLNPALVTVGEVAEKTASFSLTREGTGEIKEGDTFKVKLNARTDQEEANLFAAKLSFDTSKVEVSGEIDKTGSFITPDGWVETYIDNANGLVSIIGTVSNPGYITQGADSLMATISFQAKLQGQTSIGFNSDSVIYRNGGENEDILGIKTPLDINIVEAPVIPPITVASCQANSSAALVGEAVTWSVTGVSGGTGAYTYSWSGTDELSGSTSSVTKTYTQPGTKTAVVTVSSGTAAAVTKECSSLQVTQPPVPCSLDQAKWQTETYDFVEGDSVMLEVTGSNCDGKAISIEVKEDDGAILGQQELVSTLEAQFQGNTALATWVTKYVQDGNFGLMDPPEYMFTAKVTGESESIDSSAPFIKVSRPQGGEAIAGDANDNGEVDLQDASIMQSHWGETKEEKGDSFASELDIWGGSGAPDGRIDTFDWAQLLTILVENGVIHRN